MDILLAPPVAFLAYLALAGLLLGFGRLLAGPERTTGLKETPYSSGEVAPRRPAVPGFGPFYVVALFFALLHLGVLLLATTGLGLAGGAPPVAGLYLAGLGLALLALVLG